MYSSIHLFIYVSIYPFLYFSIYLFLCFSIYSSIHFNYIYLFIFLSAFISLSINVIGYLSSLTLMVFRLKLPCPACPAPWDQWHQAVVVTGFPLWDSEKITECPVGGCYLWSLITLIWTCIEVTEKAQPGSRVRWSFFWVFMKMGLPKMVNWSIFFFIRILPGIQKKRKTNTM